MTKASKFTIVHDEDTEKWTKWSEEFAKREFTEEELDRMFSTRRKPPWRDTTAPDSAQND
ncbi:hypothetical protein [Candidatus Poriferisodalis sp.]|uniref:hypothetical protein n=1 Tax=Candidatus Poriferisodalis sp. TaxID=3101277 RepID=UPI003AF66E23